MRGARIRARFIINEKDHHKGELSEPMRERDREIKRRRHRYQKRKKLRIKLGAASAEADQQKIEARIRKTYPSYTPAV
jgi:hypothetical protein